MLLSSLTEYLNQYLEIQAYKDWSPNGLQVEGKPDVFRVMTGVTASQRFIDTAIERGADAVLVHHGWFWKGEPSTIVGIKKRRIQALLTHDVSLLAYHLPLDANTEVGNNVMLAKALGLKVVERQGDMGLLNICEPNNGEIQTDVFLLQLEQTLARKPLTVGEKPSVLRRIGLCSGAAQDLITQAAQAQCDAYISGEISERTTHEARELGIFYISAGHHATERYGIQALGELLKKQFPEIEVEYIEDENPV